MGHRTAFDHYRYVLLPWQYDIAHSDYECVVCVYVVGSALDPTIPRSLGHHTSVGKERRVLFIIFLTNRTF